MTPEAKVKQRVRQLLEKHKAYYFMPATGGYGRSGVPDFVGCLNRRFFGIECKAGGNEPTALQRRELMQIDAVGGAVFVAKENNIADLDAWLAAL